MSCIVVAGSINMDVVNRVLHFPQPGETIKNEGLAYNHGGKGANQAVACVRAGAKVVMAGAVGSDSYGEELRQSLQNEGIDTRLVANKQTSSGLAFITVDASGQNYIVLSEGANGQFTAEDALSFRNLEQVQAILLQNEIPWETNEALMRTAKAEGIAVFFNPAPARVIPKEGYAYIDTLIVNESEASYLAKIPVRTRDEAETAAHQLLEHGACEVIITLGAQGSIWMAQSGESLFMPAYAVEAVDTTAAGDTFIGAYAAMVTSGGTREAALRYASAAAALTVTRSGAQSSIPFREEIEAWMQAGRQ